MEEENKTQEVKQTEIQAVQIVETPLQTFRQKMEQGSKQVEDILYGDGEYFSL